MYPDLVVDKYDFQMGNVPRVKLRKFWDTPSGKVSDSPVLYRDDTTRLPSLQRPPSWNTFFPEIRGAWSASMRFQEGFSDLKRAFSYGVPMRL